MPNTMIVCAPGIKAFGSPRRLSPPRHPRHIPVKSSLGEGLKGLLIVGVGFGTGEPDRLKAKRQRFRADRFFYLLMVRSPRPFLQQLC